MTAAFTGNVLQRGDSGASCAVYRDGVLVVDLWTDDWTPQGRACVFSVSKGVTTICLLMAAERGLLALDQPVASYWPEFGTAGKSTLTVRQMLSHRAGLAWPDAALSVEQLADWEAVTTLLAEQEPAWEPGSRYAYHALTFGWLAGEVLRRATGLRPSGWLEQFVTLPLGLQMSYGLARADDSFHPMDSPLPITDLGAAAALQDLLTDPLAVRAVTLGGAVDAGDLFGSFNRPEMLACEIPAANLLSNARDLARLYGAAAGAVDAIRLLTDRTVRDATQVQSQGRPFVGLDDGQRWGTGFMLSSERRRMAGDGSFGHDGAGGSLAFGHSGHRLGFGYVTTRPGGIPDERAEVLSAALRASLAAIAE